MLEIEKNKLGTPNILRVIIKNTRKWLKIREETQAKSRVGKLAEVTIKSIANMIK